MMLSARRQQILESLIEEYVKSAHPVGSQTLASCYLQDISSATVRNELMWLETMGYVVSPHTSAGRVPTNNGYRSFVNHLLLRYENLVEILSLQTGLKPISNFEQRLGLSPSKNSTFGGKASSLTNCLERAATASGCLCVYWSPGMHGIILHRGLAQILAQPEFLSTNSALPLIQLLEDEGELANVMRSVQKNSGLHIRIGTENYDTQLYAFSMLAIRLEVDSAHGVVALFGPTRMRYRKSIIAVLTVWEEITAMMSPDRRSRLEY